MSAQNPPPYPRNPHPSGQARIKIQNKHVYLGVFGSPESHRRYQEEIDRWRRLRESGASTIPAPASAVRSVADLVAAWLDHCKERRYKDKQEYDLHRLAAKPLLHLFSREPVAGFRVGQLEDVQAEMLRRGWKPRVVNRNIIRIRTMFRWAEQRGYVPEGRWNHLRTLPGLATGKKKVLPVPEASLTATLPQLGRVVRAAVEIQLLTAGRPSEVLGLRPLDIVRSGRFEIEPGFGIDAGKVWVARLEKHKTAHLEHDRFLLFGPKAQQVLEPFLANRLPDAFLFSPREAATEFLTSAQKNATRSKGSRYPKKKGRRVRFQPGRKPGERYKAQSYCRAIQAACRRAGVAPFSAYQLRHNAATRLVREFGWDVARVILGHSTVEMTAAYNLDDLQAAMKAIEKAG